MIISEWCRAWKDNSTESNFAPHWFPSFAVDATSEQMV